MNQTLKMLIVMDVNLKLETNRYKNNRILWSSLSDIFFTKEEMKEIYECARAATNELQKAHPNIHFSVVTDDNYGTAIVTI